MTNNVRDTDDGRVWGSSHCLLRKERIWRGGSKTFLLNIFLNIFALSNFTHNSTLFFFVKYCHKVFFLECFQPIFFTFEPASTSTGYWFIITNTKFMTLAFSNSIFDQVELRGGFWFDEAFVLHAWERTACQICICVCTFVCICIYPLDQAGVLQLGGRLAINKLVGGRCPPTWGGRRPTRQLAKPPDYRALTPFPLHHTGGTPP